MPNRSTQERMASRWWSTTAGFWRFSLGSSVWPSQLSYQKPSLRSVLPSKLMWNQSL